MKANNTTNVNGTEVKAKKSHKGLIITLVVLLVLGVECCFNTNTEDPEPVESAAVTESMETEKKETKVDLTKETETETEEDIDSEVVEDMLAEDGIYITPGSTYYTIQGGYNEDKVLYLNILYEDDETMRYVGFADNNGKPDTSLAVDVLMHKVEGGADANIEVWVSDDNKWVAKYFAPDSFFFGEQDVFDSEFMGYFSRLEDESVAAASESSDMITFSSNSDFKDFARDNSNVGILVNFDAYVYAANCTDGNMYVDIIWADGSTTDSVIVSQKNCSSTILDGDYVNVSAEYLGINQSGYITFDSLYVDLLDVN